MATALLCSVFISACGRDPYSKVLDLDDAKMTEKQRAEYDVTITEIVKKLPENDRMLLGGYMARVIFKTDTTIFKTDTTSSDLPKRVTVREAIERQKKWIFEEVKTLAAESAKEGKEKEARDLAKCRQNLKSIGIGFAIWAVNRDDLFPFSVPAAKGGTKEECARDSAGVDSKGWAHIRVLSEELKEWKGLGGVKTLICPSDSSKNVARDFPSLNSNNVSYYIYSAPTINPDNETNVLAHCPIHKLDALCSGTNVVSSPKLPTSRK